MRCEERNTDTLKLTKTGTGKFDATSFLRGLTNKPGVYCMLDSARNPLYVGKAKNLKERVSSYFKQQEVRPRVIMITSRIATVEVTVTDTEGEALILECNLIKKLKPRYNVVLRDDKSYPYIRITTQDEFPRVSFYRGSRKAPGQFFGPYPSSQAVRETLNLMYKVFRLRQCDASVFKSRSRPCLQYQIRRCSAPCVGLITKNEYQSDLQNAMDFLSGNSRRLVERLVEKMDESAVQLHFEEAAKTRNQIEMLRVVSEQRGLRSQSENLDIIATQSSGGLSCVQVFKIRGGLNIGNRTYFPTIPEGGVRDEAVMKAFIGQHYLAQEAPRELVLNLQPEDSAGLKTMIEKTAKHKVRFSTGTRGEKRKWLELACKNAECALQAHLLTSENLHRQRIDMQKALAIRSEPRRIECFDVSHTMGEETVASCVVWNEEGPDHQSYRRFNIKNITPGDDYAAMTQALTRHYKRLSKKPEWLPCLLIIDGGKGQLKCADEVLKSLGLSGIVTLSVAKGPQRKPGLETLYISTGKGVRTVRVPLPVLHLILRIRDEAHRFAITGHRRRLIRKRGESTLESIHGLGPKRRQLLIKHFGGLRGLCRASTHEIRTVSGIGPHLANAIKTALQY